MPPQPLSRVRPHASLRFEDFSHLRSPELGAKVAEVIRIGAETEHTLALILIDVLKADPIPGIAMYEALSGSDAKMAALKGAVAARFGAGSFVVFDVILTTIKPFRKMRNDFAHHIWGASPDIPDALLLMDPSASVAHHVSAAQANITMRETRVFTTPNETDRSRIIVWKTADLDEAVQSAKDSHYLVRLLESEIHIFDRLSLEAMQTALSLKPLGELVLQRCYKQSGR